MISIMNEQNKNKIKLHFDITLACNNRCSYCYALNELDNSKKINLEVINKFIEQVNSIKDKEIQVEILGGEPFLVLDQVIYLVDKINNASFSIFTNFNISNSIIDKAINFIKLVDKKVLISVSWHESSNQKKLKENILKYKEYINVNLFLSDHNLNFNLDCSKFLKDNNIIYSIEELIDADGSRLMTKYDDKIFKSILSNAEMKQEIITIDNTEYTHEEVLKFDLLNVAKNFKSICKLSELRIKFDGDIEPICNNPIKLGNIKNNLEIKDIYCNSHSCRCSANTYKKIFKFKGFK